MDKVFTIDYRNNITLNVGDNGLIDFSLCNGERLEEGDTVTFKCTDQEGPKYITSFVNGVAKIQIESRPQPYEGRYCIIVEKSGRTETVIDGKFVRKGGC